MKQPVVFPTILPDLRPGRYRTDFASEITGNSPRNWAQSANLTVTAGGLRNVGVESVYEGLSVTDGYLRLIGKAVSVDWGFAIRSDAASQNNYMTILSTLNNVVRFHKQVAGTFTQLGQVTLAVPAGRLFDVLWEFAGPKHRISVDGALMLEMTDATFLAAGFAGVRQAIGTEGITRYFEVAAL